MDIVDYAKEAKKVKLSIGITFLSRLTNAPDAKCDIGGTINWTLDKSPSSSGSNTVSST